MPGEKMSTMLWSVCPGDPTYVSVPGVAKPIACGSEERARLIAAAPDLFDALRKLLVFAEAAETKALVGDEGCLWPVEEARAAIAKATTNG